MSKENEVFTDDLVKILRADDGDWRTDQASDRIEELSNCVAVLEAKLSKSEALLAKAVEAAEKAVGHIERIPPRMATARVELCDALAKLKGQDDEW